MSETPRRSLRPWHVMLALLVLAAIAHAPALSGAFVDWDDTTMVVGNADLRAGGFRSILGYFDPRHPHLGLYAPLTYLAYFGIATISRALFGELRPIAFHVVGLALHLATGGFAYAFLRRLTVRRWTPLVGTALVLLHPMQVESVAWIASLNTVLSGCLTMAALWLYARSRQAGGWPIFAASCVLFALALLAKPSAAAMPLAALAIDRWILESCWRSSLARATVWAAIAAPIVLVGKLAQPASVVPPVGLSGRFVVAADAIGFYVAHLCVPFQFAIDYGRTPAVVLAGGVTTVVFAGIALIVAGLFVWSLRRRPDVSAAIVVSLAALLPVLGLLPFDFQVNSTVADRYAYLALLGPAIALTVLLPAAWPRHTPAAAIIAVALAVLTNLQSRTWADNDSLFGHALDVNPDSAPANATLGFIESGRIASTSDGVVQQRLLESALAHTRRALATRPDDPRARYNLANLLLRYGDPREAAAEYERAARLPRWADDARLRINWGIALAKSGDVDAASRAFAFAIERDPALSLDGFANWGMALAVAGRREEARAKLREALAIDPAHAGASATMRWLDAQH